MSIIVSDLDGTLSSGSTWRGIRTYFKSNYNANVYNLFFLKWLPWMPLIKLRLVDQMKTGHRWMEREIGLFNGESPGKIEAMAEWVVEQELWPNRRRAVVDDIASRVIEGTQVAVVTGAYQPIANAFANRLNGVGVGTQLRYEDDKLAGLILPVNHFQYKVDNIHARFRDDPVLAAYGDTISDVPMLEISQHPVAVYPDNRLRQIARERGWKIIGE